MRASAGNADHRGRRDFWRPLPCPPTHRIRIPDFVVTDSAAAAYRAAMARLSSPEFEQRKARAS